MFKINDSDIVLTQQDFQIIESNLNRELSYLNDLLIRYKKECNYFYDRANKNITTMNSQYAFKHLNVARNNVRTTKQSIDKLAKVQYKIKRLKALSS